VKKLRSVKPGLCSNVKQQKKQERPMNISQLAQAADVSTDTVRYYEKQGLIGAPARQDNGYRSYTPAHVELLRFVRGAQALGFSLAEIRTILPQVAQGSFGRPQIEAQLQAKMAQIDAHMAQLKTLKKELAATFASLQCAPTAPVSTAHATAPDSGSGAGAAVARRSFAKRRPATA
jgi:MerR family copper efflux transcriptional regulator